MNYKIMLPGGMDAAATFFSGQAFRWEKSGDEYEGVVGEYYVRATVSGDYVNIEASGGSEEFWREYFAAEIDYESLRNLFMTDLQLAPCIQYAPGIRVLCQPFFETLCTFIISQNNNIPRITGIVKRFCESFGNEIINGRYSFPTAEVVAAQTIESLSPLRAGFRAKYLIDAAKKVNEGKVTQELLSKMNSDEARKLLCTIVGVGPKVADCVMLYSLSKNEIIPMDVHMKRAMQERFPNGLSAEIIPYGGIAQQYIFHHERTSK